jgi:hypothetical protein
MIELLFLGLLLLLLLSAATAPLESLGWYAGWFGERQDARSTAITAAPEVADRPPAKHYIVYLSGIGAIDPDTIPAEEVRFLDRVDDRTPGSYLIRDIFPYSVTNVGMTSNRLFSRLWGWLINLREAGRKLGALVFVLNIRNMFQVAVSSDTRYGPIYNLGVTNEILIALQRHGYVLGSNVPVTLLGWSGGGQVSMGTATFLGKYIKGDLRIITLGGVMASEAGALEARKIYQLDGGKDPLVKFGVLIFPGRWPLYKTSYYNRARAMGRIVRKNIGPFTHTGSTNYFADTPMPAPYTTTYAQCALDAVIEAFAAEGLIFDSAADRASGTSSANPAPMLRGRQSQEVSPMVEPNIFDDMLTHNNRQ